MNTQKGDLHFHALSMIYPSYHQAIDAGKGDEVASAFRNAKRGALFPE